MSVKCRQLYGKSNFSLTEIASESDANAFVVPLGALSCQASSIAGGKGSQLAKLMSLQKELQNQLEVIL